MSLLGTLKSYYLSTLSSLTKPLARWNSPSLFLEILGHSRRKTISFCRDAFNISQMDPKMNKTPLCLIPIVANANAIKSYKPIWLCNIIYKLITKIIVNRLKPYLRKIIGPSQASLLSNRRASDNVIIV